jgi:hypothetical protein
LVLGVTNHYAVNHVTWQSEGRRRREIRLHLFLDAVVDGANELHIVAVAPVFNQFDVFICQSAWVGVYEHWKCPSRYLFYDFIHIVLNFNLLINLWIVFPTVEIGFVSNNLRFLRQYRGGVTRDNKASPKSRKAWLDDC